MKKEQNIKYEIEIDSDKIIVKETTGGYKIDLRKRLLNFAVKSIKFLLTLPKLKEYDMFRYQYSKSSNSVGANYEEAQSSTYKEFTSKTRISLREANESLFFLRVMNELEIGDDTLRIELIQECIEITKILGSIVSKAHRNIKKNEKR